MEIKNLKLAELRLNPTNPREVVEEKYKQLIDSILVFPKMMELRPVVYNARREVLGGNMRLRALQDIAQMSLEDIKARLECLEGYRSKPQAERVALLELWQRWLDSPYAPAASAEGLTDAEQQEFIIKDNLSFGKWDWEALANDWDEEQLGEWGLDVWQPMDNQTEDETPTEVTEDDFDEDGAIEVRCKKGDIWQLGEHRLMCGDSSVSDDLGRLLEGKEARLCVTSPPYGVGKSYEEYGIQPWKDTILKVIEAITQHARIIVWNIADLFATGNQFIEPTSMYSTEKFADCGFGLMYSRIWKKQGGNFAGTNPYYTVSMKPVQEYEWILGYAKRDYEKDYAPIISWFSQQAKIANLNNAILKEITGAGFMYGHWFTAHQYAMMDEPNYLKIQQYCKGKGIQAFQTEYSKIRREYDNLNIYGKILSKEEESDWGQWAIWNISTVNHRTGGHPAEFPVELPARCIKMHSRPDDIILDCFGGSGTTLIAAEQLGRTARLMEIDPHYCDVIIARWEKMTGKTAKKIN